MFKQRVMHYAPEFAAKMIIGCVVLHNLCLMRSVPEPEGEQAHVPSGIPDDSGSEEVTGSANAELAAGRRFRSAIINSL